MTLIHELKGIHLKFVLLTETLEGQIPELRMNKQFNQLLEIEEKLLNSINKIEKNSSY